MPKAELPRFVIYQPNEKEYHICLEADGKYLRWCSTYAPTLDVAFPRQVTRIEDMPLKSRPKKKIYDEGTYSIPKAKTKAEIEEKLLDSIKNKSLSFSLNGKILKGRFSIKQSRGTTVIQKYKDKYAKDEDVLSGDLIRTINEMVPNYDESKVDLNAVHKTKGRKIQKEEDEPVEEITADKTIGGIEYHFAFYASDDEPEICLITSSTGAVLVLKKEDDGWSLLPPMSKVVLKKEEVFTEHAKALYDSQGH